MKALAGGWALTGTGALLGLGTTLTLWAIGPSKFDPARSCHYRFDESRTFTAVERSFPPRVTCVRDDGQTFEYLSSTTTLTSTVLLAVSAALVLAGAALLAATWLRRDAVPAPPPSGSRAVHLWLALLLGLALTLVVTGLGLALYLFLGPLAALFLATPALLGAAALAAALDRHAGPPRPGPRRRGTTVTLGGALLGTALVLATFTIDALAGWTPLTFLLAVLLYPAIAAAQHFLPSPAPSTQPTQPARP
ncbi:hypothetical protein ACQEVZ_13800 [Dactylosporangium sp. CA-152071]|uniref:hypothetical protein n=1 Tax=Dactylosporangium sp. CA-152071 TaxID=3239933 RepID=UPI003D91D884